MTIARAAIRSQLASHFDELLFDIDGVAINAAETSETFRHFIDRVEPGYQHSRHTEVIGSVVERIVAGSLRRVIFSMPPRRSKSRTITQLGGAFYLRKHGDRHVGIGSYNANLAADHSRLVRRYWLASHGRQISLEDAKAARSDWETGAGGGCWGVGIGGGAGYGWSLGFLDDPHKNFTEARSPAHQRHHRDWYEGVWMLRAAPDAAMVIVTNRWAVDDLIGWQLDKEEKGETINHWHLVILDEEHVGEFVAPPGCTVEPDWREAGELLWPERYPNIEETRSSAGRHYHSTHQQRPVTDVPGALWTSAQIEHVAVVPVGVKFVKGAVGLDPAAKHGPESDETGIVGGAKGDDGRVYVMHDRSGRMPPEAWARAADWTAQQVGARKISPEDNNGGEMIRATFRAAGVKREVELITSTDSKMIRAEPVAALYAMGKIVHVGWFPELEMEQTSYTGVGKSPNRLDALVTMITYGFPEMLVEEQPNYFAGRLTFGR